MTDSVVINGVMWGVVRVPAGDPRLRDRTGTERLGTTDPYNRVICIRSDLTPPMLDRVVLHEVGHAVTLSWGIVAEMRSMGALGDLDALDEASAQLIENHSLESLEIAKSILGRPVCVDGVCAC